MSHSIVTHLPVKLSGAILAFSGDSEKALVERAKSNPEAFGALFDKYYDDIFRYVFHRTGDRDLANDITSDTFHIALEKLWRFKWMNLPFSAWLYRIATNEVNGFYRKQKKYSSSLFDEETSGDFYQQDTTENKLNEANLFEQLRIAVKQLDQKYQEVIVFRYFEEMSINDICKITGKVEGTVKSLIHRGLKLLETKIDEELYKEFKDE